MYTYFQRAITRFACLLLVPLALLLEGCASTSTEPSQRYSVSQIAQASAGAKPTLHRSAEDRAAARTLAAELLNAPLSSDDAVRLAITLSPAFQEMLAVGAAQSSVAEQSARLSNPIFTFDRLARREGGFVNLDISRMLSVSLLELIYLPLRIASANAAQSQVQLRNATAVVETAAMVRQAWVRAVAAEQSLRYFEQVMEAADASSELAKRMQEVGNFSRLQRAQQQAFYADATLQLTKAKQAAVASREALVRLLGLDAELAAKLNLPERLPELPKTLRDAPLVAQSAIDQRLDVQMQRAELESIGARAGFAKASSFVNAFHIAAVRNSASGSAPQRGYELELPIPVFDWGDARRAQYFAEYTAASQRLAQTLIDAESSVREQYAGYRASYALATHYRDEIVPLRKVIADETLLRYNGMLLSVFDLLAATRSQIGSVILAIDAERDFWLADAALQATLLGKPMTSVRVGASPPASVDTAAH